MHCCRRRTGSADRGTSIKSLLIKPNNHELGQIFGKELKTEKEIIDGAMSLKDRGAVNVLVSMAKDGAILVDEKWKSPPDWECAVER